DMTEQDAIPVTMNGIHNVPEQNTASMGATTGYQDATEQDVVPLSTVTSNQDATEQDAVPVSTATGNDDISEQDAVPLSTATGNDDTSEQDTVPMGADGNHTGQTSPAVAQSNGTPWHIYPLQVLQKKPLPRGYMIVILVLFSLSSVGTLISGLFAVA